MLTAHSTSVALKPCEFDITGHEQELSFISMCMKSSFGTDECDIFIYLKYAVPRFSQILFSISTVRNQVNFLHIYLRKMMIVRRFTDLLNSGLLKLRFDSNRTQTIKLLALDSPMSSLKTSPTIYSKLCSEGI